MKDLTTKEIEIKTEQAIGSLVQEVANILTEESKSMIINSYTVQTPLGFGDTGKLIIAGYLK